MADSAESTGKVLAILHSAQSNPGRLRRLLAARGLTLDCRKPCLGDPLPDSLSGYRGAIVFGGPMCANDPDDFIRREIDWIGIPLREDKPFLGICLGAQMFARHLGHRVYRHPHERVEVGYYPISPTEAGHRLCDARFPSHVYHWHEDGFELPRGATLLAGGHDFEVQACRYGRNAVALQFHPEVTYACICRWTIKGSRKLYRPGAQEAEQHFSGWHLHDPPVAHWLTRFLDRWLSGTLGAASCAPNVPEHASVAHHHRPVDMVF